MSLLHLVREKIFLKISMRHRHRQRVTFSLAPINTHATHLRVVQANVNTSEQASPMSSPDDQFNFLFTIYHRIAKHLLESNYQENPRVSTDTIARGQSLKGVYRGRIASPRLNVRRFRSSGNEQRACIISEACPA